MIPLHIITSTHHIYECFNTYDMIHMIQNICMHTESNISKGIQWHDKASNEHQNLILYINIISIFRPTINPISSTTRKKTAQHSNKMRWREQNNKTRYTYKYTNSKKKMYMQILNISL